MTQIVVAAVIERGDRRILIGQRRKTDTSPLKWEFPGGKVRDGESPEQALARELLEELGVPMKRCLQIASALKDNPDGSGLEVRFFVVELERLEIAPGPFEAVAWVLPKELSEYDFLAANRDLVSRLATGKIRPAEILAAAAGQ